MKKCIKVKYKGKDLDDNFSFKNDLITYKLSVKQISKISKMRAFETHKEYGLIIENNDILEVTTLEEINIIENRVNGNENMGNEQKTSSLIEKIELREIIKKYLKLGEDIDGLVERLAKLQGEDEAIKFIEEARRENEKENKIKIKEYAKEHGVDKTLYLVFCFVLGGIGIHKFYAKKYIQGVLYLTLCWTWVPVIISIIEGVIAIREPVDENGKIYFKS